MCFSHNNNNDLITKIIHKIIVIKIVSMCHHCPRDGWALKDLLLYNNIICQMLLKNMILYPGVKIITDGVKITIL